MRSINEMMKEHYIAGFKKRRGARKIGLELELIAVHASGNETGLALRPAETISLLKEIAGRDIAYSAIEDGMAIRKKNEDGEIELGTDYGSGTLELKLPPKDSMLKTEEVLHSVLNPIIKRADEAGVLILGYGTQPISEPSEEIVMPKKRYDAIRDVLRPWFIRLNAITASTQVHVDVDSREAITLNNTLNAISPAIIALCANSAIVSGTNSGYSDYRGVAWDEVVVTRKNTERNMDRKGIAPDLLNMDEYWDWLIKFTPILTKRNGKYLAYQNVESMQEYLDRGCGWAKTIDDGKLNRITPEPVDLMIQEGTVWTESRLKSATGTVELRSPACQPDQKSMLSVGAMLLGIASGEAGADYMASDYRTQKSEEKRKDAIKNGMRATMSYSSELVDVSVGECIRDLLLVSERGLSDIGENKAYLKPLWSRLQRNSNPSDESVRVLEKRGMQGLLESVRLRAV